MNFTRQSATAKLHGAHEVALAGDGSVANPFKISATVTFTAPSGAAKTVDAFYDGGNTWRARVYVSEAGQWRWAARSVDPGLDQKSGAFTAVRSSLRGMLRKHAQNPKQWMTDDGRWFLNLNDTAYMFFNARETRWREYVKDNVALGITSMRAGALGGIFWEPEGTTPVRRLRDNWPWDGENKERYNLEKFQTTDARLQWLLDNYPDVYVQFILFGLVSERQDKSSTGKTWQALPASVRTSTMRYMLARWAAYPQLFWLVVNDMYSESAENQAFAREVGRFFAAHDSWRHLLSAGVNRNHRTPNTPFPFTTPEDLQWASYVHLETFYDLPAELAQRFSDTPLHVFCGEEWYKQEARGSYRPLHPRYCYHRLFWSWLLAGGSPNYGGRWTVIHPYKQTGSIPAPLEDVGLGEVADPRFDGQLTGLDSVPHIAPFFKRRRIELWRFAPDDALVSDVDGRAGYNRPKAMRNGVEQFLIYHPNAKEIPLDPANPRLRGRQAAPDADKAARCRVNLTGAPQSKFAVEWFRVHDGLAVNGGMVAGGAERELTAPWRGHDVVLYLNARKP